MRMSIVDAFFYPPLFHPAHTLWDGAICIHVEFSLFIGSSLKIPQAHL